MHNYIQLYTAEYSYTELYTDLYSAEYNYTQLYTAKHTHDVDGDAWSASPQRAVQSCPVHQCFCPILVACVRLPAGACCEPTGSCLCLLAYKLIYKHNIIYKHCIYTQVFQCPAPCTADHGGCAQGRGGAPSLLRGLRGEGSYLTLSFAKQPLQES